MKIYLTRTTINKKVPGNLDITLRSGFTFCGHHHTEEAKKAISEKNKGQRRTESMKAGFRAIVRTPEWGKNISLSLLKGRLPKSPLDKQFRNKIEWGIWRKAVFARDSYTCQWCEKKGGRLEPHHIKRISEYPELVYDVDNGLTLCQLCHSKTKGRKPYAHIFNK